MTLQDYISTVRARLEKATPGPWYVEEDQVRADLDPFNEHADCTVTVCEVYRINEKLDGGEYTRELIANAPTDLSTILSIVEIQAKCIDEVWNISDHLEVEHASLLAEECIESIQTFLSEVRG